MKIVIVGGGTAGWLAGLMISKAFPQYNITLIESSSIGIIGAGEGSTGILTSLLSNKVMDLGTDIEEFIIKTGATLKYGIMHRNWTKKPQRQYFGPLGGSRTANQVRDWHFLHQMIIDPDNIHHTSVEGIMLDHNLVDYKYGFDRSLPELNFSFHFDAHKVGQYFKSKATQVKHIDAIVKDVVLDENGFIKSVLLDNQQSIESDFFIDASGFQRVLMNKLDNPWVSYSDVLPVNSAMPFLLPSEETPKPYTVAWAQKYGWMWQIPTLERRGCGYVFCDKFTTPEKAQEEIEKTLGQKIDPIRVLNFDTGILKYNWRKNCLAVGLSSAFAEPLEATSIHSTIMQLLYFIYNGIANNLTEYVHREHIVTNYNYYMKLLFENYRDFLNIHYMAGRDDSEFWRYMQTDQAKTEKTKLMLEIAKHRVPNSKDFINLDGSAGYAIWSYVLAGIGAIDKNLCKQEFGLFVGPQDYTGVNDFVDSIIAQKSENMRYDTFIQKMKVKYDAYTNSN